MNGGHFVRFVIPIIFALYGGGSERHEAVYFGIVQGELDDVPANTVPADVIAVLKDSE